MVILTRDMDSILKANARPSGRMAHSSLNGVHQDIARRIKRPFAAKYPSVILVEEAIDVRLYARAMGPWGQHRILQLILISIHGNAGGSEGWYLLAPDRQKVTDWRQSYLNQRNITCKDLKCDRTIQTGTRTKKVSSLF